MSVYKVKAATSKGKIVFRDVEARSVDEIKGKLEREGLLALEISGAGGTGLLKLTSMFQGRARASRRGEFLVFNQGLKTLLRAGLPVIECLETLMKGKVSASMVSAIEGTIEGVRTGMPLSDAMQAHPEVFPSLYIATIAAGEKTGDLVPSISGYIEYIKRVEAIRKKVVTAVTYPSFLTIASLFVVAFLVTFVVPIFAGMYEEAGAELPLASSLLIAASVFVKKYLIVITLLIISAAIGIRAFILSGKGGEFMDALKLKVPMLGGIYHGYAVAKFARTLSMLLDSGMSLIYALEMSRGVLNNVVLEEKLARVIKLSKEGGVVSEAMAQEGLFPDITLRMFSVGEKSASLAGILTEIADYHDGDVDHRVSLLTDLIEPALMIFMGLLIGTIVILLYLPIFQLGANI